MSVYKEAMYTIAQLVKKQERIYQDACDYGIPIFDFDCLSIKLVKQLEEMYGPVKRNVSKYATGSTVEKTFEMIDEFGDGKEFKIKISYITTRQDENSNINGRKGMKGYISVESDNDKWLTSADNKYFLQK